MPVSATLDAGPAGLRQLLRRTTAAMTVRIAKPRGAASPLTPAAPRPLSTPTVRASAQCSCPCSVELPGEIA
jgi:hypothetical protein